ncbi:hypothetical protein [Acetobacter lambici]|uniref:Uncharacterized protein n=1 Tax=Acetobacter lambici TaxID=1332824 RepID=A0ABT1F336_9PROT|nr:hypothetical protein [Acetobacter lambici]MCP1243621.1 hypothetical protein [Acetobacter lambici]MCP1259647.1 hypothetical protein [Acetobacter lambici]
MTAENRLFLRTVCRIADVRDDAQTAQDLLSVPHIFGAFVMHVPVLPDETLADVRATLKTMLEFHGERMDYTNNRTQQPYTVEDWSRAVDAWEDYCPADATLDKDALPFSEESGCSPTQWAVQAIAIDDEDAALDLLRDGLGCLESKETVKGVLPASYMHKACIRMPDGELFTCRDAVAEEGRDPTEGEQITIADLIKQGEQ